MTDQELQMINVPRTYRGLVYLIGMLGFPIVIAVYVLVVLSADLKSVDKSLNSLSNRIDERPMSIEKTTDFVIYVCEALNADLQSGLPGLVASMDFVLDSATTEQVSRKLSILDRQISQFVRPIVRKHQRFASRFPSSAGNIGEMFETKAPGRSISEGATEAHLAEQTYKDLGETINALLMNIIGDFGDLAAIRDLVENAVTKSGESDAPDTMVPTEASFNSGSRSKTQSPVLLMDSTLYLQLASDSIHTATTVLRDQMLLRMKQSSSEGTR